MQSRSRQDISVLTTESTFLTHTNQCPPVNYAHLGRQGKQPALTLELKISSKLAQLDQRRRRRRNCALPKFSAGRACRRR